MLISIECRDAADLLGKIMAHAHQGDLIGSTWENNALSVFDEGGPIRFIAHLDHPREMLSGLATEFVHLESFTPVAMPNRDRALKRKRVIAERFRATLTAALLNDGLESDSFKITIADL